MPKILRQEKLKQFIKIEFKVKGESRQQVSNEIIVDRRQVVIVTIRTMTAKAKNRKRRKISNRIIA